VGKARNHVQQGVTQLVEAKKLQKRTRKCAAPPIFLSVTCTCQHLPVCCSAGPCLACLRACPGCPLLAALLLRRLMCCVIVTVIIIVIIIVLVVVKPWTYAQKH
jgi:hypothetical protein